MYITSYSCVLLENKFTEMTNFTRGGQKYLLLRTCEILREAPLDYLNEFDTFLILEEIHVLYFTCLLAILDFLSYLVFVQILDVVWSVIY